MSELQRFALSRLLLALVLMTVAYFAFSAVNNALQTHRLRQEEARVQQEIQQLQEETRRLEALSRYLSSDEYIESMARGQLGLTRPGETPIRVLPAGPAASTQEGAPATGHWWDAFLRR